MSNARTGKIARLPAEVRRELNLRLKNGEPASVILPWLNALPEVQWVLTRFFGGLAVNEPNLCAWRRGGYLDWDRDQAKSEGIRELGTLAASLPVSAVQGVAVGAGALAGARIFELLETVSGASDLGQLGEVVRSLGSLRAAEIARDQVEISREWVRCNDEARQLAREKLDFQRWRAEKRAPKQEPKRKSPDHQIKKENGS